MTCFTSKSQEFIKMVVLFMNGRPCCSVDKQISLEETCKTVKK